jgi:hypothetical protein
MRPADRRFGFTGWNVIGEYDLRGGQTVRAIWLPTNQTDCHIVVYDAETLNTIENVNRLNAAGLTEELLVKLES